MFSATILDDQYICSYGAVSKRDASGVFEYREYGPWPISQGPTIPLPPFTASNRGAAMQFCFDYASKGRPTVLQVGERPLTSRALDKYGNKSCQHHNAKGYLSLWTDPLCHTVYGSKWRGRAKKKSGEYFIPDNSPFPALMRYSVRSLDGPLIDIRPPEKVDGDNPSGPLFIEGRNERYEAGQKIDFGTLRDIPLDPSHGGRVYYRLDVNWTKGVDEGKKCILRVEEIQTFSHPGGISPQYANRIKYGSWVTSFTFSEFQPLSARRPDIIVCRITAEEDYQGFDWDNRRSSDPSWMDHHRTVGNRWLVFRRCQPYSGSQVFDLDTLFRNMEEDYRSTGLSPHWSELAETAVSNIRVIDTNMIEFAGDVIELKSLFKGIGKSLKGLKKGDPSELASLYLSFHYGLKLFVQDVQTISSSKFEKILERGTRPYETTRSRERQAARGSKIHLYWTEENSLKLYYGLPEENSLQDLTLRAWRAGSAPSADQLWDLVPLSFVVDWFADVQAAMQTDTTENVATQLLKQYSCICTSKASTTVDPSTVFGAGVSGALTIALYRRNVSDRLPPMSVRINTATSFNHWFEGTSLIVAMTKRKR